MVGLLSKCQDISASLQGHFSKLTNSSEVLVGVAFSHFTSYSEVHVGVAFRAKLTGSSEVLVGVAFRLLRDTCGCGLQGQACWLLRGIIILVSLVLRANSSAVACLQSPCYDILL